MLRLQITNGVKDAMRARDTLKLSVYRYILSEIKNREIDAKHELVDDEIIDILKKEVKRRREAVTQFKQGGRTDLVTQEEAELVLIEAFLPQMMTIAEIEVIVGQVIAQGETNFGTVMKLVMQQTKGLADGKVISDLVKQKLN